MKGDAGRSFEVFEFKEEDELPNIVPGKFLGRMKKDAVTDEDDAILKYNYLGFVSNQMTNDNMVSGDAEFVDADSVDSYHSKDGHDTCLTSGEVQETDDVIDILSEFEQCKSPVFVQKRIIADRDSRSFSQDQDTTTSGRVDTCSQILQSIHDMPECDFRAEDQIVDTMVSESNSEERMSNSSPADLLSDLAANSVYVDDRISNPYSSNQENQNKEITVQPDIVMLNDNYIWDAEMYFTSNSIQLTSLNTCGSSSARYEWSVDNIISIEAQWHERVHVTVVLVHLLSQNSAASDPSGIQEIKFTVHETDWASDQESIMSLNDKYKPLFVWNVGQSWPNQSVNGRLYYPEFDESFDELVYPKDDSDPVTICKRDIDLLEPEIFINDTIIDFYIKYLKNRLEPEKALKIHFFNSFFFRKLADLERSQFDASEGRASFLRVRKWTRKVNLFEKDYIFIPVNSNLHWSLIVICHPGEIAKFEDNNAKSKHKVPCILHMDSIKGSHTGLKNHIQSYLWEEWKEKQNESTEEISSKFQNLRFISLEVPQQENSYDCGLFLLHYVELFLEETPESFNPFHITKYSTFLNTNWFPPGDVSLKRAHIQRIIYNMNMKPIHLPHSSPSRTTDQIGSPRFSDPNTVNEAEVELLSKKPSLPESCRRELLCGTSQEKEPSTLGPLSASAHLLADDPNLVLQFHDQASINGLPDAAAEGFNHRSSDSQLESYISSVEENTGNDDHMLSSLPNGAEFTTQSDQASFQFEDYRMQNMSPAVNSAQEGIEPSENSECLGSLNHESDDFLNDEVESDAQMKDAVDLCQEDKEIRHVGSSSLAENNNNLSETTCCPSPVVLESAFKKMPDCSKQINTSNITDDPMDTSLLPDGKRNGDTSGAYNQESDVNTSDQLEELRVPKRARIEAHEEVKSIGQAAKYITN